MAKGVKRSVRGEVALPQGKHVTDWLMAAYTSLEMAYGDLHWWPAESTEEMVIGAILVQNVSWKNTQKALQHLIDAELLSFQAIHQSPLEEVASCVVPTRFFNMKAKRLKSFASHLVMYHEGNIQLLLHQPMDLLRQELLSIDGIGPETADDIVLYGAGHPSFVVDAYTKRILSRCGVIHENVKYDELRHWFMEHLPAEPRLFNQFHALLDRLGNRCCLARNPKCTECPLNSMCALASRETTQS